MIPDFLSKVNAFFLARRGDFFIAFLVVLTGTASFALGRLSRRGPQNYPISIERVKNTTGSATPAVAGASNVAAVVSSGTYVASRNGSVFHLPTCPGAKRIKEENKRWFATKEDAIRAGFRPAANCPGL